MKEVLSYIAAIVIAIIGVIVLAVCFYFIFVFGMIFIAGSAFIAVMSGGEKRQRV